MKAVGSLPFVVLACASLCLLLFASLHCLRASFCSTFFALLTLSPLSLLLLGLQTSLWYLPFPNHFFLIAFLLLPTSIRLLYLAVDLLPNSLQPLPLPTLTPFLTLSPLPLLLTFSPLYLYPLSHSPLSPFSRPLPILSPHTLSPLPTSLSPSPLSRLHPLFPLSPTSLFPLPHTSSHSPHLISAASPNCSPSAPLPLLFLLLFLQLPRLPTVYLPPFQSSNFHSLPFPHLTPSSRPHFSPLLPNSPSLHPPPLLLTLSPPYSHLLSYSPSTHLLSILILPPLPTYPPPSTSLFFILYHFSSPSPHPITTSYPLPLFITLFPSYSNLLSPSPFPHPLPILSLPLLPSPISPSYTYLLSHSPFPHPLPTLIRPLLITYSHSPPLPLLFTLSYFSSPSSHPVPTSSSPLPLHFP